MNPFAHARVRQTSAAGFDALHTVCDRLAGFGADVDLEFVDGYLAGLAVLPQPPASHDWLPALAGDAFARAFADPDDEQQALRTLQQRLKVLAVQLDPEALADDPGALRLQPCLLEWTDADRQALVDDGRASAEEAAALHTGADWASGVFAALHDFAPVLAQAADGPREVAAAGAVADDTAAAAAAFADVFDRLGQPLQPLLHAIYALTLVPGSDEERALDAAWPGGVAPRDRDERIDAACFALQDLRLALLDALPPVAPRRVAAAPGRNDPCPCGSGRKFKKCHGAGTAT